MPEIIGTDLDVEFSRVVDGDTIRTVLPGAQNDEALRILALDPKNPPAVATNP